MAITKRQLRRITKTSSQTSDSSSVSSTLTSIRDSGTFDEQTLLSANIAILADVLSEEEEPSGTIDALELGVVSLESVAVPTSQKTRVSVSNSYSLSEVTGFLTDVAGDGFRPKVILTVDAADFAAFDTHQLLAARRLLRYMRLSNMDALTDAAFEVDPNEVMTALSEGIVGIDEDLTNKFSAIQFARNTMDSAANSIDLRFSETAIMDLAASLTSETLTPSETAGFTPPGTFSSFLTTMVGLQYGDERISNSKLIGLACNDITRSIYTIGPGTDSGPTRRGMSNTMPDAVSMGVGTSYPSLPSAGTPESSTYHINHNETKDSTGNSSAGWSPGLHNISSLRFRKNLYRPCWGDNLDKIENAGSGDTWAMRATIVATTLSNILITSAGIGRLEGAELGSRFSVSDGKAGLEKAFGALPLAETDNILDMTFEEGCVLDSVVLGEELGNTELRILPFEAGSYPNEQSPPVVSGRDYFTEMPMRYPTADRTNDFSSFASSFSSIVSDATSYLDELYAISEDTLLSPEKILSVVMQEFATYLRALSVPSSSTDWNEMVVMSCKLFDEARTHDELIKFDASKSVASAVSEGYAGLDTFYGGATLSAYTGKTGLSAMTMLARQAFLMSDQYDALLTDDEKAVIPLSSNFSLFADEIGSELDPYAQVIESNFSSGLASIALLDGTVDIDTYAPRSTSELSQAESLIFLRDICNNKFAGDGCGGAYDVSAETGFDATSCTDYLLLSEGTGLGTLSNSPDTSLVYSAVRLTRSLQKAAMDLAQREDAEGVSYLDANRLTHFGNLSDHQLMFLVVDLYSTMAKLVFSMYTEWNSSERVDDTTAAEISPKISFSSADDASLKSGVIRVSWDHDNHEKMASTLEALVSSISAGSKLSDLFTSTGDESSIAGVSKTASLSREGTSAETLIGMLDRAKLTRRHVKFCSRLIKAISDNLISSSTTALSLIDFLSDPSTNSLDGSGLSESALDFLAESYTTAAGNQGGNTHEYQLFRFLTEHQLSLKAVDKERMSSEDGRSSFTMKSASLSTTEKLSVDSLIDKIAVEDEDFGNGYLISSIGLPAGSIDNLRRQSGFSGQSLATTTSTQIKMTKSTVSEVFKTLEYDPQTITFDFEIFLLPDSFDTLASVTETGEEVTAAPLWADVVDSAVLYRIRSGEVLESGTYTVLGLSVEQAEAHVRSHVISLLFFELFGMSLFEGDFFLNNMSTISKPGIDVEAYDALAASLSDVSVSSSSGLNVLSLENLLDPGTTVNSDFRFVRSDAILDNIIHGEDVEVDIQGSTIVVTVPPKATREELKRIISLGQTSLYAGNLRNSRILAPSRFDRVFNFMMPKIYSDGDQNQYTTSSGHLPGATLDLESDLNAARDAITNYDVDSTGTSNITIGDKSVDIKELAYHLDTIYYSVEIV
jgi:hypothetical protein